MKETSPKLTPQKKREANKFIDYIFNSTGIKFKCRTIKDYVFLKMLYLLLIDYEDIEEQFYIPVANHYKSYKILKDRNYYGYSLNDILKEYIIKYYYNDLTNFAVTWEFYRDLVEDDFDERLAFAYITLEKKMEKNEAKIIKLLDNIGIKMVDDSVLITAEESGKPYMIKWHSFRDSFVCKDCDKRNNRLYYPDELPEKHPNCRCWFEIVYK